MAETTLYAAKDTFLGGIVVDQHTNYGSNTSILHQISYVGEDKTLWYRPILEFDASGVGGTPTAAKLRLYTNSVIAAAAATIYRITDLTWTEAGADWIHTIHATDSWAVAGGDYEVANGESVTPVGITTPSGTGWYEVTGMLEFVEDAIDNRSGIVSMLIRFDNISPGSSVGFWFDSKENGSGRDPELVVTYTPLATTPKPQVMVI